MDFFERYRLEKESDGYILVLYLDSNVTEFSDELGHLKSDSKDNLYGSVLEYVKAKFPDIKIKTCKVVLGSLILAVIPVGQQMVKAAELPQGTTSTAVNFGNYTVVSGDNLWLISSKVLVPVAEIKAFNNLVSDNIYPNQVLKIPSTKNTKINVYNVVPGDTLWGVSKKFNVTIDSIKKANNLTSDSLRIGQYLIIPAIITAPTSPTAPIETSPITKSYTVIAGDTLWGIAKKFNVTVDALKTANKLSSDSLSIGQVLIIPASSTSMPAPTPPSPAPTEVTTVKLPDNIPPNLIGEPTTITYKSHTVAAGENSWSISLKYGIPADELLKTNNLTQNSVLNIGQSLKIPVHNIPVQPTISLQYGEYLDWWTQAQYLFTINKIAKVTDIKTGRSFSVKRTMGAFHADCEPLTANDALVMKEVWGGTYSWSARAVLVEIDGRKIAASMYSMPHGVEYINDNNYEGHFDIHFLNSTRHADGLIDESMQSAVKAAAGLQK